MGKIAIKKSGGEIGKRVRRLSYGETLAGSSPALTSIKSEGLINHNVITRVKNCGLGFSSDG